MNKKAWTGLCLVVILLAAWALGPVPAFAMDEDNLSGITEVKAGIGYTIQFASGDGSGSMEPVFWTKREAYELPPCAFTAPEKKAFKKWSVVIGEAAAVTKAPNETITVTANTTVTAVWEDVFTVTFDADGGTPAPEAQTVAEGGKATVPDTVPTKENFKLLGWYLVDAQTGTLSDTAFDFENTAITADITLKAKWADPVTLTATMTADSGTPTGTITGTGAYFPGDEATLTAPRVEGYNFVGWFAADGTQNLCSDRAYTFIVGDVISFVAKYKALPTVSITIDGGNSYTVNGSTKSIKVTQTYYVGSTVTVATERDDFDYWADQYGSILSRNKSYSFTVANAQTITAEFKTVLENKATLVFESYYGQVFAKDQLALDETMTLPPLPTRTGYNTLGWDCNGDGEYDASSDTLNAAITRGLNNAEQLITIYAVYELKPVTYTVTVNNSMGSGTYQQHTKLTVTAEAPGEGKKFSHWESGGKAVCYETSYQFFVDSDITLTAVYVDDSVVVEAVATTRIVNMYKDETNKKLSYVSMSTVPEGFTIQKAGVIATDDKSVAENDEGFNDTTAKRVFGNAWSGTAYQYTFTKAQVNVGDTWYARAYLVYMDTNGNTHTIYGEVVSQTL